MSPSTEVTYTNKMAAGKGKNGKRWCFTLHNWSDADIERLKKIPCKYMVVGIEVGEKGTPHLQGYVRMTKTTTFNAVKKMIGARAHIEQARGTELENDEYCRKDGVIAFETGTMNPEINSKGCKAQSTETIHKLIALRLKGVSVVTIAASDDVVCYYKYERMIEKTVAKYNQEKNIIDLKATYVNINWRLWQLKLIEYLEKEPDQRKILWFVDEKGNSGKTFITKYLLTEGDTLRYENGKSADVKYALDGQRIVVFDLSRSQETHVNYEVIESVKNGVVFSTKYESQMKVFKTPHVLIMANFAPDESKMSADRWDIRYLNEDDNKMPNLDDVMDVYLGDDDMVFD